MYFTSTADAIFYLVFMNSAEDRISDKTFRVTARPPGSPTCTLLVARFYSGCFVLIRLNIIRGGWGATGEGVTLVQLKTKTYTVVVGRC